MLNIGLELGLCKFVAASSDIFVQYFFPKRFFENFPTK